MNPTDSNPEPDIKPGDVVYFKSGSPPFIVYGVTAQGCSIVWLDESISRNVFFNPAALTKVNPAQLNAAQAQLDAAYAQHNEDLKKIDELQTALSARGLEIAKLTVERDTAQQEIEKIQTMFGDVPVNGGRPIAHAVENMIVAVTEYAADNATLRMQIAESQS